MKGLLKFVLEISKCIFVRFDLLIKFKQLFVASSREIDLIRQIDLGLTVLLTCQHFLISQIIQDFLALCLLHAAMHVVHHVLKGVRTILLFKVNKS